MTFVTQLVWTRHALQQLEKIGAYIAKDNPLAATKLLVTIKNKAEILKRNPLLGRRTEFEGVRELVVHPNYLLSYRASSERIEIVQVWRVAQQRYH